MERNGLHNKLPTTDRTRCRLESFLPDAGLAGPSSLVKCPRDYNPDYSLPSREEGGLFVSPAHSRMRLSYGLFRRTSGLNTSRFGEAAFDISVAWHCHWFTLETSPRHFRLAKSADYATATGWRRHFLNTTIDRTSREQSKIKKRLQILLRL